MVAAQIFAAYAIVFLPLMASAAIALFGLQSREWSARLSIGSLLAGFAFSAFLFSTHLLGGPHHQLWHSFPWISVASLQLHFGVMIDSLSILMSMVVTGVGSAIFIYSQGYMHDDPSYARYFAKLAFFAFAMLGIVFSVDLLQLFIFWELVGLASYLLIGFWYQKPTAAEAGLKAFLVNRVGDFGFLLGILVLWSVGNTLMIPVLSNLLPILGKVKITATLFHQTFPLAALLIFAGVAGKSAQFPLHVWLPDAMEGPTPVSALIHAATMVAAGIYLLCRLFFLFGALPQVLTIVAWIGGVTAIFAALIAVTQFDIKRVLAYSTLSQLGYMVLALGLGGYTAAMFHLTTHAFFKALLFMGAGSVIHALHDQDIRKMGGLLKSMPITSGTFLVGSLALAGIFPLSGFWSKDEILALAAARSPILYGMAIVTAFFTAFYIGRLCFTVFFGDYRGQKSPHESPKVMTSPLIFLAILSAVGGVLGIPSFLHHHLAAHVPFNLQVALFSTGVAGCGVLLAAAVYLWKVVPLDAVRRIFGSIYQLAVNKFYVDEVYGFLVWQVQQGVAMLCGLFERNVIVGFAVNGVAWVTRSMGDALRFIQTGVVQTYAFGFVLGLTFLVYRFVIFR